LTNSKAKPPQLTPKLLRDFGYIMAAVIGGIIGIAWPYYFHGHVRPVAIGIGVGFLVTGLTFPLLLAPIFKIWMIIGEVLGAVNSRIILGLVFWITFVPVAVFFRITGRDILERKLNRKKATYRIAIANDKSFAQSKGNTMSRPF
jgi:hypothetical protein